MKSSVSVTRPGIQKWKYCALFTLLFNTDAVTFCVVIINSVNVCYVLIRKRKAEEEAEEEEQKKMKKEWDKNFEVTFLSLKRTERILKHDTCSSVI